MLPLWIIDITNKTDRQAKFQTLIGQLNGVTIKNAGNKSRLGEVKNQWFYTQYDNNFPEDKKNDPSMPNILYQFQEQLVSDGQEFIRMLRESNVDVSITMNICVIGDVTEDLTQLLFPSIAILIEKEKGRIVPNHIHQGLAIIGALFVPSNINSLPVSTRQSVFLTFREIDVQHKVNSMRGYDRMFIYQDVQNRTESYFSILDSDKQAEYLFQSMLHLYYACNRIHPLIDGSGSNENFYFSLGCASTFFDTKVQDTIDVYRVANSIIETLNETGNLEKTDDEETFVDLNKIEAVEIINHFQDFKLDLSKAKLEEPHPHPIQQFKDRKLKKLYYENYLKYYPANLRLKIQEVITQQSEKTLEEISAQRKFYHNLFAETTLPAALKSQLDSSNPHIGCLKRVVRNLKNLTSQIGTMKGKVSKLIESNIWNHLLNNNVPQNLKDDFESYHDAYKADLQSKKKNFSKCEEMKQSALKDFANSLKKEATFLGRLSRAFLLGIISVLTIVPILTYLSPSLINLGDVKGNAFYWSAGVFIIPLLMQFVSMALYNRKRKRKERRLTAYYLHDAYSRIANRIETEVNFLYDNMIELSDTYINRCKKIEKEIRPISLDDIYEEMEIIPTTFNQPIIGGKFGDQPLIQDTEDETRLIYINKVPCRINVLNKEDRYLLVHQYKDELMKLFANLHVTQKHARRLDDTLGYKVFVSKAERLKQEEEEWENSKKEFKDNLLDMIRKNMQPRKYPTIGEKIVSIKEGYNNYTFLNPLVKASATNGELTSTADIEHFDVKCNNRQSKYVLNDYLPENETVYQLDETNPLYQKYLFVTRWRTFDYIALNRILPTEDFDMNVRKLNIKETELSFFKNAPSSIILWALCSNDNSGEWLRLFDGTELSETLKLRKIYTDKLNTKD